MALLYLARTHPGTQAPSWLRQLRSRSRDRRAGIAGARKNLSNRNPESVDADPDAIVERIDKIIVKREAIKIKLS